MASASTNTYHMMRQVRAVSAVSGAANGAVSHTRWHWALGCAGTGAAGHRDLTHAHQYRSGRSEG